MIKNLTLLALVLISLISNAQIKKGTLLIGGQLSAGKSEQFNNYQSFPIPQQTANYQSDNYKYVVVGVSIGKAIKDNKVIGVNFNTANFKQTYLYNLTETSSSKNSMNEAGIFYRSYKKLGKDFYIFGQVNALINFGKTTYNFTNSSSNKSVSQTGGLLSFSPGLAYAVFKKFHIELTMQNLVAVQYITAKQTFTNPTFQTYKTNFYSFNSSLTNGVLSNIVIGFRLIL